MDLVEKLLQIFANTPERREALATRLRDVHTLDWTAFLPRGSQVVKPGDTVYQHLPGTSEKRGDFLLCKIPMERDGFTRQKKVIGYVHHFSGGCVVVENTEAVAEAGRKAAEEQERWLIEVLTEKKP